MTTTTTFWWPLFVAALVAGRGAAGSPTRAQLRRLIAEVLFEDTHHRDVLSERVKLHGQPLPPSVGETVQDLGNVDPLVTLHALVTTHQHFSGDDLDLSLAVVGTSVACLAHKRVAVHLALIVRLIGEADGQRHFPTRIQVFRNAVPYYIDTLSSINRSFDDLLGVYNDVSAMASAVDFGASADELTRRLEKLSAVIESSCVVSDMKEYFGALGLAQLEPLGNVVEDGHRISADKVSVADCVKSLKENENAMMDSYEKLALFRNTDMAAWKIMLAIPNLPVNQNEFLRTSRLRYSERIEDIFDKVSNSAMTEDDAVVQAGDPPPGDAPPGEAPPGDAPPGEVPPGNAPPGEAPPGQSQADEISTGGNGAS